MGAKREWRYIGEIGRCRGLTGVAYWLRHCATSRTVPGSIPGGHWGFFSVAPPDGTMCPEVDSGSESEYQGFLLTTYHPRSAERQENPGP